MNLRTSLLALLLTFAAGIFAQAPTQVFLVGEVSKSVILHQAGKKLAVAPGDQLPLGAMLTIPENGRLVVYNEAKLRQYTILKSGTYTLAELLDGSKKKNVPEKAIRGIIKLVTSGNALPDGVATIDREIHTDSTTTTTE
jgi:hypothetical protein